MSASPIPTSAPALDPNVQKFGIRERVTTPSYIEARETIEKLALRRLVQKAFDEGYGITHRPSIEWVARKVDPRFPGGERDVFLGERADLMDLRITARGARLK